ncbi:UPF0193 protein EVG1 homolog [Neocloeon triangulifer]|uniref:UPF0193 protein EVG1 homolog n=1 Tax=Neocloeon triangulifer TaxID=2078957 RepID=UPI00286F29BF|nr:UPF0193 protein EVG1 homolog [Neocloeon triangulifer]
MLTKDSKKGKMREISRAPNSATQQYSDETLELLKGMMEECRLSMLQRKRLQQFVDRGEPLPALTKSDLNSTTMNKTSRSIKNTAVTDGVKQVRIGRKRTKTIIATMGAYERENCKPKPGVDKDVQKLKLQNIMAFGIEMTQYSDRPDRGKGPVRRVPSLERKDRFDELIEDIHDRCQFLQDVAELGKADQYKSVMESEIAAKLSAMKAIDPLRCEEFKRQLKLPCTFRVSVKNKA